MLPVMQQQDRAGVRQDVLLTLQRMARLQWQIHSAATEDRQNSRVQRAAFGQADTHHNGARMPTQQRLQTLGDGSAVVMQLAVIE